MTTKRFYNPFTKKRVSKKKALDIAIETGKMLTKQKMTIREAREMGYDIPVEYEKT